VAGGKVLHPRLVEGEVRVIGNRWSPRVHQIKAFLSRGRVAYRWLDSEIDEDARALAGAMGADPQRSALVLFPDGSSLVDPEVREVATRLGLEVEPGSLAYDLIVVGGGPAGLSAAIYGATDGLRTVVVEQDLPGGQASYSALIENYPGFPRGLSGTDLARRSVEQAERFGVEILVTRRATGLRVDGEERMVMLDNGTELVADAVLLSLGVSFRWLDAPGCRMLVGAGVYYGAAIAEAGACRNQDIYILGGGNSAGQAALLLSQFARRVTIVALEPSLEETMSAYLVQRIRQRDNIEVRTRQTVVDAEGSGRLEWLVIKHLDTGETERVRADGLFIFIGATPRTDWLGETVLRDEQGFIVAGDDIREDPKAMAEWPLARLPFDLETSTPGVFVAGDVRHNSVKRLASAVGEGATAVHYVHRYRKESRTPKGVTADAAGAAGDAASAQRPSIPASMANRT
jgi:thioredoxin reductase (NADPH)